LFFCFSLTLFLLLPLKADAATSADNTLPQTNACNSNTFTYTAEYSTAADTYNIYARMGKRTETAQAQLYYQSFTQPNCQTIGSAAITGTGWTRLGQLVSAKQLGTLTLASPQFQDVPGANSPTVLLVSATHPTCQPTTECYVTVAGKTAVVHAAGNTVGGDTLHVVTAQDPATDKLQNVDYYVDDTFAYSTPAIEPFNMHYVSGGEHSLAIVATYKSKQQLVIASTADGGYVTDIGYYVNTFWHRQRVVLEVVGLLLVAVVCVILLLELTRKLYQRHLWRQNHGLIPVGHPLLQVSSLHLLDLKRGLKLGLCLIGLVAVYIVLNSWVFELYQVDGHSMESTYYTGHELLVNKLPKTYDSLRGSTYVPKRGQVIVFIKAQDVSFQPTDVGGQTYLVKRVIGLPGERVTVKNGVVMVYNKAQPAGFDPDTNASWSKTMHLSDNDQIDVTLQPDEIFVCGDNRPVSVDSRTFGPVKVNEVVGLVD
jgi:signal peptidase I